MFSKRSQVQIFLLSCCNSLLSYHQGEVDLRCEPLNACGSWNDGSPRFGLLDWSSALWQALRQEILGLCGIPGGLARTSQDGLLGTFYQFYSLCDYRPWVAKKNLLEAGKKATIYCIDYSIWYIQNERGHSTFAIISFKMPSTSSIIQPWNRWCVWS